MFQTCLKFPFSCISSHLLSLILPFICFFELVFWEFSPHPLLHYLLFFPDFSSLLFVQHRASQSPWWHAPCILPPHTALPPSYDNMLVIWAAPPCAESRAGGLKETEPTWVCTELDLWVQIHTHFCTHFLNNQFTLINWSLWHKPTVEYKYICNEVMIFELYLNIFSILLPSAVRDVFPLSILPWLHMWECNTFAWSGIFIWDTSSTGVSFIFLTLLQIHCSILH